MKWKHFLPFVKESIPSQKSSNVDFLWGFFYGQHEQTFEQTVKFMVLTLHSWCDIIVVSLKKYHYSDQYKAVNSQLNSPQIITCHDKLTSNPRLWLGKVLYVYAKSYSRNVKTSD